MLPRPRRAAVLTATFACALLAAWFGHAQPASAAFFTYSTSVIPVSPTTTPGGVTVTLIPKSKDTPSDTLNGNDPGTDIVFGNISVSGLSRTSAFETISIPYHFHVLLSNYVLDTDTVPNDTVDFDVSGVLGGSVGDGNKVNISNLFTNLTIDHVVGGDPYEMRQFSYVAPTIDNNGAFGAHVIVTHTIPEPATMTLLVIGAIALATPAYRRWRRISPRTSG